MAQTKEWEVVTFLESKLRPDAQAVLDNKFPEGIGRVNLVLPVQLHQEVDEAATRSGLKANDELLFRLRLKFLIDLIARTLRRVPEVLVGEEPINLLRSELNSEDSAVTRKTLLIPQWEYDYMSLRAKKYRSTFASHARQAIMLGQLVNEAHGLIDLESFPRAAYSLPLTVGDRRFLIIR